MLETLNEVFLPTLFKTLAVTCGIGGGFLILAFMASIMILILYPITRKFN